MMYFRHWIEALLASAIAAILVPPASAQCGFDKLTPSQPFANGNMGSCVATDGDLVVVGAPEFYSGAAHKGSVYVFERSSTGWKETARLRPNAPSGRNFGRSVAVWRDTIAVGGMRSGNGHVFIFQRGPAGWREVQRFPGPDDQYDFGNDLKLRGDTLLVGGEVRDFTAVRRVFVYHRDAGGWTLQHRLRQSDDRPFDVYGYTMAVDADTIAVGAFNWTVPGSYFTQGAVYLYEYPVLDSTTETLKIDAPDPTELCFGAGVALSGDTMVVGTLSHHAYFFERAGDAWRLTDAVACESSPGSVAIEGDTAALFCWPDKVRVLGRSDDGWIARSSVSMGTSSNDSVRLALTPTTLIVTDMDDDEAGTDAGAVYFLDLDAPGRSYCCPAHVNSTGQPGRLLVYGSRAVADDDLLLTAKELPVHNLGTILMGDGSDRFNPPGSSGPFCLGGSSAILRVRPAALSTDQLDGGFSISPGTSGLPTAVMAGTTWNFQAWYRDAAAGTTNTTNAVSVTFE